MNQPQATQNREAYQNYLANALAALTNAGLNHLTPEVEAWVEAHFARGTAVDQLQNAWNDFENVGLVQKVKAASRMEYVKDELTRKLERATERKAELAAKLKASDLDNIADLAAENIEALLKVTTQVRMFGRFMKAIQTREQANEAPTDTFAQLSGHAYREAALGASHQSIGSSWGSNEAKRAELAAAGEIALLFVDVSRI